MKTITLIGIVLTIVGNYSLFAEETVSTKILSNLSPQDNKDGDEKKYNQALLLIENEEYEKAFVALMEIYDESSGYWKDCAANSLGWCFLWGKGVGHSILQAYDYFKEAAEHGIAAAQTNLGAMLFYCNESDGDKLRKKRGVDYGLDGLDEVYKWLELSAAQKDSWGLYYLAEVVIYEVQVMEGAATGRKYSPLDLYLESASLGNTNAMCALGTIAVLKDEDVVSAKIWFEKAQKKDGEKEWAGETTTKELIALCDYYTKRQELVPEGLDPRGVEVLMAKYKDVGFVSIAKKKDKYGIILFSDGKVIHETPFEYDSIYWSDEREVFSVSKGDKYYHIDAYGRIAD